MKRSNSFCLMRVVLIVQSAEDILRAKSVIYCHYLLLNPSVGCMLCTYTSTLFSNIHMQYIIHPL